MTRIQVPFHTEVFDMAGKLSATQAAGQVDTTATLLRKTMIRLQTEIAAKRNEVRSLSGDLDAGDDFELMAQSDSIAEVDTAEILRDLEELRAAEHALARLEAGQYGLCEACEQPIPAGRLTAQPTAVRCVACQEALEAGHSR